MTETNKDRINNLLNELRSENITTWFDLGLFLDSVRENRNIPGFNFSGTFRDFEDYFSNRGIAFITFHYSVDGVTVEVGKYARLIKADLKNADIHYISGVFKNESGKLIPSFVKKFEIPEIQGFDDWKLYKDFYFTRLERGSETYNQLIKDFWEETLIIVKKLGKYIIDNKISLLYLINVCSNPGNVSLSLACVLLSEYLKIPVINNNHDFYWEGGNREMDIIQKKSKRGPRDFFFTNSHLGEVFSIIETIFPWESRNWINVNINRSQSEHIISKNGHNPSNVMEIGTAVDTNLYQNIDKRAKINSFIQFEKILSRYKNQLISYSVDDVINSNLVNPLNTMPILVGKKTGSIEKFTTENIIFLQPTRIISRKRIEIGFRLLMNMLKERELIQKLRNTPKLKITILVTGPIAAGHFDYFQKLLCRFSRLFDSVEEDLSSRLFLAFLFSELDKSEHKNRFEYPIGIPELYNISSLILLPSKTEGRGLPIIEATACGTPIFCRRYSPKNVYSEVIGEHLSEKERLKVIEFDGKKIKRKHVRSIIERVFFPHKFGDEIKHNRKVVIKRYSLEALNNNIREILYRTYLQSLSNDDNTELLKTAFKTYSEDINYEDENLKAILDTSNRQYLAGYGKLAYMIYLKSLIDPSFFRVEEQEFRGRMYRFAQELMKKDYDFDLIPLEKKIQFFNSVHTIFYYHKGEVKIRHDHSMSYRHRNKNYYPYQDYTLQELTGIVNILYFKIIEPSVINKVGEIPHFFTDWNLALLQLTGSNYLMIDNRKRLINKIQQNIPIAYFPGEYLMHELELFALQAVRSRLDLPIEEPLTDEILANKDSILAKIYVFTQEKSMGRQLNKEETIEFIIRGNNRELKLLYEHNLLEIVPTEQWTVGIHFPQLGSLALKKLREVRKNNGFLITNRRNAVLMTDIIDIDRFHIGKVRATITENMLGIPLGSGYIQFVPASVRTILAYPTPIQKARDFNNALNSKKFKELSDKFGEEYILNEIRSDAIKKGSPVIEVIERIDPDTEQSSEVKYNFVSGTYSDGNPYNGVIASIDIHIENGKWEFSVVHTKTNPKKVNQFVHEFEKANGLKARIGWNGGYILNPELVGKLGIPESYIGSPLGLLITEGELICPPLFNKAALLIHEDGRMDIKRVNCSEGIIVTIGEQEFHAGKKCYNPDEAVGELCYYDLMYENETIKSEGRIIVRLSGIQVKDIIRGRKRTEIIPVGLTLSFREDIFPDDLRQEDFLKITLHGFEKYKHAVEAGPMLLENGEINLDMQIEGWKKNKSIQTQAARLDYTDMRGPKIAAGIDAKGNLSVLAINGRIRESVGATHNDMAEILKNFGLVKAMGFDPGGSSTLLVEGKTRNISPYNRNYERNIYSLPPEPRAVSNAIIGYITKK